MKKDNFSTVHRVYGYILSISLIIAAINLAVACVDIYHMGDKPFTREIVAEKFGTIDVPIYICLGSCILVSLLHFASPQPELRPKLTKNLRLIRENAYRKATELLPQDGPSSAFVKSPDSLLIPNAATAVCVADEMAGRRRRVTRICTGVAGICAIVFLAYALNFNNFHRSEINDSLLKAVRLLVPCLAVSGIAYLAASYYTKRMLSLEAEVLKKGIEASKADASKSSAATPVAEAASNAKCGIPVSPIGDRAASYVRLVLLALGIVLLVYGFATGGVADVMTKAVNICTECIGLG